jgi:hypothetical protein
MAVRCGRDAVRAKHFLISPLQHTKRDTEAQEAAENKHPGTWGKIRATKSGKRSITCHAAALQHIADTAPPQTPKYLGGAREVITITDFGYRYTTLDPATAEAGAPLAALHAASWQTPDSEEAPERSRSAWTQPTGERRHTSIMLRVKNHLAATDSCMEC